MKDTFLVPKYELKQKKNYDIPPDASDIWLIAKEQTGSICDGWRTVFDLRFNAAPNQCFKPSGTTLKPHWSNDCD
jgi:hypothetical protein